MLPENDNEYSKDEAISSNLQAQADNGTMRTTVQRAVQQLQILKQPNNHQITLPTNGYDAGVGSGDMVYSGVEPRLLDNLPGRLTATTTFGNYNQTSFNTRAVAQRQLRQYWPYSPRASSSDGGTNRPRKGNCIYWSGGRLITGTNKASNGAQ